MAAIVHAPGNPAFFPQGWSRREGSEHSPGSYAERIRELNDRADRRWGMAGVLHGYGIGHTRYWAICKELRYAFSCRGSIPSHRSALLVMGIVQQNRVGY